MKRTLYDLLGVRRDASRAEIEKAYDRLKLAYGGTGAVLRDGYSLALVDEAFATLSDPAKRGNYDASLQKAAKLAMESHYRKGMAPTTMVSGWAKWALPVLMALVIGGWYWKASSDAQIARARDAAELRSIEAARITAETEAERLRFELERDATRQAADERRMDMEMQAAVARYGAQRAQAEYSDHRRSENERRQAEREQIRKESMERQAREREIRQQQIRDAQDRRYLDQFKERVRVEN